MQTTRIVPGILIACTLFGCSGGDEPGTESSAESGANSTTAGAPAATSPAQGNEPDFATWHTYSGGADASQYSSLGEVNKENVATLRVAWSFPSGDANLVFNPIVVGDVMYVLRARGQARDIVALNAATGAEIWSNEVEGGVAARGIHYWQSASGNDRRLVFHGGGFIKQINAATGATITSFGDNGRIDLREALDGGRDISNVRPLNTSNPGRVFENLMIVSLPAQGAGYDSTPGNVGAWDILTGDLAWVFHAIPHPGEVGYDTWPEGAYLTGGGVHNWSEFTVDAVNGIVFVPFGSPRYDFYGGGREGDNLFGNSLVAINARTGEYLWHQQLVHHDLWDYDLPQAPKLLNLTVNGREIEAVAQATKQGFLFVFDRHTGEHVWPVEERPVPQSDLPGEHTSPTQPFPVGLEPFADQSFSDFDINPYLPEAAQERLRDLIAASRYEGPFTPPSFEGTIAMPGHNGGANWGGSAVDPANGELYVVSKNLPVMLRAAPTTGEPSAATAPISGPPTAEQVASMRAEAEAALAAGTLRYSMPYEFLLVDGLAAVAPPYSHLTAYDLDLGRIKWRIPNGSTPGFPENSGAHMPRGAPLATAGGLLFVATAQDRMIRAYDRDTGAVLWAYELPNGSEGIPATYAVDGRQYLVVNASAGTGLFPAPGVPQPPGDRVYMVFSLP
jgi:quinoprotein glucose dehydrogenase